MKNWDDNDKGQVTVNRNREGHTVDAHGEFKSGSADVRCEGLTPAGEAFWSDVSFENVPRERWDEVTDELKRAARDEIRRWWDYNGSRWSEPVEKPEELLVDERDEHHAVAIMKSAFHGGGILGYAMSEESAQDWIKFKKSGGDCRCGCFYTVNTESGL